MTNQPQSAIPISLPISHDQAAVQAAFGGSDAAVFLRSPGSPTADDSRQARASAAGTGTGRCPSGPRWRGLRGDPNAPLVLGNRRRLRWMTPANCPPGSARPAAAPRRCAGRPAARCGHSPLHRIALKTFDLRAPYLGLQDHQLLSLRHHSEHASPSSPIIFLHRVHDARRRVEGLDLARVTRSTCPTPSSAPAERASIRRGSSCSVGAQ